MACAWHCARNDELSNLYITYSNTLGGAFLDGVMEIIKDPTYAFSEVFPGEEIVHTDSEAHRMNMTRRKKYATLSGRGMEAGLNGQFDAKGWLILDDLHEGTTTFAYFALMSFTMFVSLLPVVSVMV